MTIDDSQQMTCHNQHRLARTPCCLFSLPPSERVRLEIVVISPLDDELTPKVSLCCLFSVLFSTCSEKGLLVGSLYYSFPHHCESLLCAFAARHPRVVDDWKPSRGLFMTQTKDAL